MQGVFFYTSAGILVLFIGLVAGWLINKKVSESHLKHTRKLAENIIAEAQREAETQKKAAILEAKDEWYQAKLRFEKDTQESRQELKKQERRLEEKEQNINRKVDYLENREQEIGERQRVLDGKLQAVAEKHENLDRVLQMQNDKLERLAGLSKDEAKKLLITNLESEARHEAAKKIRDIREEAERNAVKESREILTLAIERCAADHVVESTVSVVDLPSDEMKGRIIGREGRNIRAFENATGIDVIIDDTPEAGDSLRLRSDQTGGRPALSREARQGRSDSSWAYRGGRRKNAQGAPRGDPRDRRADVPRAQHSRAASRAR